jgi:hypothetical protein
MRAGDIADTRQIAVYFVVIFALWNLPGGRQLINPLKLMCAPRPARPGRR